MTNKKVVLASASPRRKELLSLAGIEFETAVSETQEVIDQSLAPDELVKSLAEQKAMDVAGRYPGKIVVGADTVVALDGKILGKPKDEADAFNMLKALSGRTHNVYTGVCVVCENGKDCFCESTQVEFFELTDDEIREYISSGEPMDKAGAYGIQGKGCVLIKEIKGDYYTVVGLPIAKTFRVIKNMI